jgi:RNA recognition motif-containing protein
MAQSDKGAFMGSKLYVGNLSYNVTSSQLEELFSQHGTVQSAEVIQDRDTGRSKGFGFVQMGSDEEAQAAITSLNGQEHDGRALTVNEAKPREERPRGGGGGYGGGGGGGYGGGGGGRSGGGGGYGGGGRGGSSGGGGGGFGGGGRKRY